MYLLWDTLGPTQSRHSTRTRGLLRRGYSGRSVKLTTHNSPVPRLKMCAALLLIPRLPSPDVQGRSVTRTTPKVTPTSCQIKRPVAKRLRDFRLLMCTDPTIWISGIFFSKNVNHFVACCTSPVWIHTMVTPLCLALLRLLSTIYHIKHNLIKDY